MIFMSPEHVARMNELLGADAASKAECARLTRRWELAYELTDGGQMVYWTMSFDPAHGVTFSLAPPAAPADILLRGEHRAMLEWIRRAKAGEQQQGPEPVTITGSDGLNVIGPAFAAAQKAATLQTEIPAA